MINLRKLLLEKLDDSHIEEYRQYEMTPDARKATDHFFGKDNDKIEEPINLTNLSDKSEIHKAIEKHLNKEISTKDYINGKVTDHLGREVRLGRLIKDENLKNQFASDTTREGAKKLMNAKVSIHRGIEVAGQTHPDHSWGDLSCKNIDSGCNRHYLKSEVREGSVVMFGHDHTGNEIYRATLQPYENPNDKSDRKYTLDAEYGVKHPEFTKKAHEVAQRLSGKNDSQVMYNKNHMVYNDNSIDSIINPDLTESGKEKFIDDKKNNSNLPTILARNPDFLSPKLFDKVSKSGEIDDNVLLYQKNATPEFITSTYNKHTYMDLDKIALHHNTPKDLLDTLSKNEAPRIRIAVANNPNINSDTLHNLVNDEHYKVSETALNNPNFTQKMFDDRFNKVSDHNDEESREKLEIMSKNNKFNSGHMDTLIDKAQPDRRNLHITSLLGKSYVNENHVNRVINENKGDLIDILPTISKNMANKLYANKDMTSKIIKTSPSSLMNFADKLDNEKSKTSLYKAYINNQNETEKPYYKDFFLSASSDKDFHKEMLSDENASVRKRVITSHYVDDEDLMKHFYNEKDIENKKKIINQFSSDKYNYLTHGKAFIDDVYNKEFGKSRIMDREILKSTANPEHIFPNLEKFLNSVEGGYLSFGQSHALTKHVYNEKELEHLPIGLGHVLGNHVNNLYDNNPHLHDNEKFNRIVMTSSDLYPDQINKMYPHIKNPDHMDLFTAMHGERLNRVNGNDLMNNLDKYPNIGINPLLRNNQIDVSSKIAHINHPVHGSDIAHYLAHNIYSLDSNQLGKFINSPNTTTDQKISALKNSDIKPEDVDHIVNHIVNSDARIDIDDDHMESFKPHHMDNIVNDIINDKHEYDKYTDYSKSNISKSPLINDNHVKKLMNSDNFHKGDLPNFFLNQHLKDETKKDVLSHLLSDEVTNRFAATGLSRRMGDYVARGKNTYHQADQEKLLTYPFWSVREGYAMSPDIPTNHLKILSKDEDEDVSEAAKTNLSNRLVKEHISLYFNNII